MHQGNKKTILDFFKKENKNNGSQNNLNDSISETSNLPTNELSDTKVYLTNKNDNNHGIVNTNKRYKSRSLVHSTDSSSLNISESDLVSIPSNSQEKIPSQDIINKNKLKLVNFDGEIKKIKSSKIINDFLNADPFELESQGIPTENSQLDCIKQEDRYEFLIDIKDKNGKRKGEEGYDPSKLYIPERYYKKFTPFEKQFWDVKSENYDTVIFFKKGKFYELYEDDAEIASRFFDLRVTERVNMKMAGFPESSYEVWASKFLSHGYKIGKVEQIENSIGKRLREQNSKKDKIISRELVEIVTQGTIYNSESILGTFPLYLSVLVENKSCHKSDNCINSLHFSILLYDSSINKIFIDTLCETEDLSALKTIFAQNNIRELITDLKMVIPKEIIRIAPIKNKIASERRFEFSNDDEFLCYTYLFNYMKLLKRQDAINNAACLKIETNMNFMNLDGSTLNNLDILTNNYNETTDYSLFKSINYCMTPFGQRLLKRWIASPLTNLSKIKERRDCALLFINACEDLYLLFKDLNDVERYHGRLGNTNPSFKDVALFHKSLIKIKTLLKTLLNFFESQTLEEDNLVECATNLINNSKKYYNLILNISSEFDSNYKIMESEILPGNKNDELILLNNELNFIRSRLDSYLNDLKISTGCSNLCYKSIGKELFQVEAPSNLKMPTGFYTVSVTKNAARFYSKDLKDMVTEYAEAEEKIFQSQNSILRKVVDFFKPYSMDMSEIITFISTLDCYMSFAKFNKIHRTIPPVFTDTLKLVKFGNPVYSDYIRNDFLPECRTTLITGPNMGGKSTFLRSICLNIILAQMGMGVIAEYMSLPIFDKIYTRIGASDSLAKGESTFMIELNEMSKILNSSTQKSLVIIDELGRGTSTRDGEAIARAVLDYMKKIGCYTLFSTHYHKLVESYTGVDKAYVKYKLENDNIVFLYKLEQGVCNNSHGLYIAKLAGVPEIIVKRAVEIREKFLNK